MYFPYYEGMVTWSLVALGNFLIAQGSRCAVPTQRCVVVRMGRRPGRCFAGGGAGRTGASLSCRKSKPAWDLVCVVRYFRLSNCACVAAA